ncbi:hypothetical protein SprV_0401610700 [Sparganum proliferum]
MALVARELARYKVDIAALSETRFSDQGQLEEMGAGHTFFWGGSPRAERRDAGVAFAIRNDIVGHGLHTSPETWEDLAQNRQAWMKEVKTGPAIYEASRIVAVKAKREARKSQMHRLLNANHPSLVTCSRCQCAFRAGIGL